MSSLPKKGDIIINPKTQRPVKVGSRTWLKLVREGIVEGQYKDPKEIYSVQDGDDEEDLINQFNQSLPITQQAVRGRGKYANKIVKRNRQPSTRATARQTVRATARKVKDPQVYEQLQEADNFEDELEQMIMAELTNIQTEPSKYRGGGQETQEQYYTEPDDDDFTTDINEEFDNGGEDEDDYEDDYEDSLIEDIGGGQYEEEEKYENFDDDEYVDDDDDFSEGSFE